MATRSTSTKRPRQIGDVETRDRLVALIAKAEKKAHGDRSGNARAAVLADELQQLGYSVDVPAGLRAVHFIERHCRHTKAPYYGVPFHLRPWQLLIVFAFFGCIDESGDRLFYRCWFEVGKKNGKTELIAAILLYCLFGLGDHGAEVYSAASSRDQAGKTYKVMRDMLRQDPVLRLRKWSNYWDSKKTIANLRDGGEYEALSADANYNDGCNPSAVGVDEVHRHKSRDLWDVLRQGQGTRRAPVFFGITTAGAGRAGIAWDEHQHADAVIRGVATDKRLLAVIYSVPEEADWKDPKVWPLANPALGDFLRIDDLEEAVAKAETTPTEEHQVRRLRLNQWVAAETKWLDLNQWERCGGLVDEVKLAGRDFYGGIDISHSKDWTAWALFFPDDDLDGELAGRALWRFWMPENALETHRAMMRDDIRAWAKAGRVTFCEGDEVDLRAVRDQVLADCREFNVREIGYDRFHAHGIIHDLMEELGGDVLADVSQGYAGMNVPAKELERMVGTGRLNHGGNPVMRWMAANAVAETDRDDRIRPSRLKSTDKIDGIMAICMAIERAIVNTADQEVSFISFAD